MRLGKLKKISIDAAVFVYILAAITVVICPASWFAVPNLDSKSTVF